MKAENIKVGQILKDGTNEIEVIMVNEETKKIEVQYISGVCITYSEKQLKEEKIETYIF